MNKEKRLIEIDNEIKSLSAERFQLNKDIQEEKFNLSHDEVVEPYIKTLLEKGYFKAKIKEGAVVSVDRGGHIFPNIYDEIVDLDTIFYVEDRGNYFDAQQEGFGFHCNVAGRTLYGNGSIFVKPKDIIKVEEDTMINKIVNCFNAGDSFRKFNELIYANKIPVKAVDELYKELNAMFSSVGPTAFLSLSATKVQSDYLMGSAPECFTHNRVYQDLMSVEQKENLEENFGFVNNYIQGNV